MKAVYAFMGNGLTEDLVKNGIDLDYFVDIPSASVAVKALDYVSNPAFIAMLVPNHSEKEIADLKRKVYRSCIAYGVPLPSRCVIEARMLDVIVP
jgi:hypothetical protein